MSYSAKAILTKVRELKSIEKQKRAQELKLIKEEEEGREEQLQKDLEFFSAIGKKCIEAALDGKRFCIPEKTDLEKYKHQILQSGLSIDELNCDAKELKEDFPSIYEELGIDGQLALLKKEFDEILDNGSEFYDIELASINDLLYSFFENACEDEWYVHLQEKNLIDEINETTFINSELYESDDSLLQGMSELLIVLKKYQNRRLIDEDSEGDSNANIYLEDMISHIDDIQVAIKKNTSIVKLVKKRLADQQEVIDVFLENTYKISIINWEEDYSNNPLKKYNFLHPRSLGWLADNIFIQSLFKSIERKIIAKGKFCEFSFDKYGPRTNQSELLYDGLYCEDFLIEITIEDLANTFKSLDYKVELKYLTPKTDDVQNRVGKYTLRLSW